MKQIYRAPNVEVLALADEDILTSSPLSVKKATDAVDAVNWSDFF